MTIGFIKGIKVKISPELEEQKLRAKVLRHTEEIKMWEKEVARCQGLIKRANHRIKKAKYALKTKFADIDQLT